MVNRILLYAVNTGAITWYVYCTTITPLFHIPRLSASTIVNSADWPRFLPLSSASLLCVILVRVLTYTSPLVPDMSAPQFAVQKNSLTFLGLVEIQAKRRLLPD